MDKKEFDKLVKESMKDFSEHEEQVKTARKHLNKMEEELEAHRQDLLLNLMHHDPRTDDKPIYRFVNADDAWADPNSKSIVINFKAEDDDKIDLKNMSIAIENGVSDDMVGSVLGYALSLFLANVFIDDEKEREGYDISFAAAEAIVTIAEAFLADEILNVAKGFNFNGKDDD